MVAFSELNLVKCNQHGMISMHNPYFFNYYYWIVLLIFIISFESSFKTTYFFYIAIFP